MGGKAKRKRARTRTREQKFGRQTGLATWRAAKMQADARLAELALAEREGRLVPRAAVLALEQLRATEMRSQIVAQPGKWAPRGVGLKSIPEVQAFLQQVANDLLETLGRTGAVIRDRLVSARDVGAPGRARRGRPHGTRAGTSAQRR
jgi:hypothetical protein